MHLQTSLQHISELFSGFIQQIKSNTALGLSDINKLSENVMLPLFKEIYGYEHLEKLESYQVNHPAVDLGDEYQRVAIQITSTPSSEKIKDTLRGFVKHRLFDRFDRLIVYIITEKQNNYSGSGFDEIIGEHFAFDKERDILDYRDLLRELKNYDIARVRKIERILESNFGEPYLGFVTSPNSKESENVTLNYIELTFGSTLYLADIAFERQEVISNSKTHKIKLRNNSPDRDVVRSALEQLGYGTSIDFDWVSHDNKIITFHDLSETSQPLRQVVDEGTITPIDSKEFYGIDEVYERVFKELLRRCLQQMLSTKSVRWNNESEIFYFISKRGEDSRKEKWIGERTSEREVFVCTRKEDKPEEIWYCKHFAFAVQFRRIADKWYMVVKPDWFFTFDGYRKHSQHNDKVTWLKRQERNPHVLNHLRFLAHFLTNQDQPTLFDGVQIYPFLQFGDLATLSGAPYLDDKQWVGREEYDTEKTLKEGQLLLFSEGR